jgi:elongation factor 1-gamma
MVATPTYKLYSPPGSFRALAPLIVAEYNQISIEVVLVVGAAAAATAATTANPPDDGGVVVVVVDEAFIATKSPTGKAPILECLPSGHIIFSSYTIARYLAGLRRDSTLLGSSFAERIVIDEWIHWIASQVELPACVLFYPMVGCMTYTSHETSSEKQQQKQAKDDFAFALQLLENHLAKQQRRQSSSSLSSPTKTYLVDPQHISLADIVVVCTLLYPFMLVCESDYLQPYRHVVQWFQHCVHQPEFVAVVGHVELYHGK